MCDMGAGRGNGKGITFGAPLEYFLVRRSSHPALHDADGVVACRVEQVGDPLRQALVD
ncbi:hypothetical protein GCM10027575_00320 [Phytohabitans suffuscus]